jgi:hypothetical protein
LTAAETPLAGVFRVVYFLALATVALFAVLTGVMAFYDPPADDALSDLDFSGLDLDGDTMPDEIDEFVPGLQDEIDEQRDYNRNVTLIYTAFAAGLFAVPLLGLGRRFNPLRAGLIAGGLLLFLVGMAYWSDSTDKWIGWLMTLICALVLLAGFQWLEDGIPMSSREPVRRIEIPPAGSPPPPPPPHPQQETGNSKLASGHPPESAPPPAASPPEQPTAQQDWGRPPSDSPQQGDRPNDV